MLLKLYVVPGGRGAILIFTVARAIGLPTLYRTVMSYRVDCLHEA
jgi:hypothetical protein